MGRQGRPPSLACGWNRQTGLTGLFSSVLPLETWPCTCLPFYLFLYLCILVAASGVAVGLSQQPGQAQALELGLPGGGGLRSTPLPCLPAGLLLPPSLSLYFLPFSAIINAYPKTKTVGPFLPAKTLMPCCCCHLFLVFDSNMLAERRRGSKRDLIVDLLPPAFQVRYMGDLGRAELLPMLLKLFKLFVFPCLNMRGL